jgi:hypothetical protein
MLKFCLTCQKDRPYSVDTWRTVFTKSGKKHYHMCPHCAKARDEAHKNRFQPEVARNAI